MHIVKKTASFVKVLVPTLNDVFLIINRSKKS